MGKSSLLLEKLHEELVWVPQKNCWFSSVSLLMSERDRTQKLTINPLSVRPLITSNFKTRLFLLNPTWHRSFYPACSFILKMKSADPSDTFGNKTEAGWEYVVRSGWIGERFFTWLPRLPAELCQLRCIDVLRRRRRTSAVLKSAYSGPS